MQVYTILLIITDGEIHDMQTTIEKICAASLLPISIIIVGVGDEDFKGMKVLDGGDNATSLRDSKGNTCQRDIVQFVKFNDFKSNPDALVA